ncbi:ubiquitin-like protein 4A [Coccinella septempunctata]|uniref:ubiquitin-like protein 4A n=1 Tax=Coccinella septempunctata TaxID=41139 RepID=UPI001D08E58C|nr:ubiquitin-like protein 4A [Coccinella septempunctata]
MKIMVKCLKGGNCLADVDANTTIAELKKKIETDINIPAPQQTLVLSGKTLQDDKPLSFYPNIQDGTKLYVAVKKQETLYAILGKFLRQYYTEEQCKMIVEEFMRNFNTRVKNLSLDDLERIAISDKEHL